MILLPQNTTETWADHFTTRGWTSPQDQIAAGYPLFCQPAPLTGSYSEVWDFGSAIPAARAEVAATVDAISGTPGVTVSIDTSANGTTWTTHDGVTAALAIGARFVRVRIDVASDGLAVARISGLTAKMSAKTRADSGLTTANAGDSGGTWVPFGISFLAQPAIVPVPSSSTAAYATATWSSGSPTGFRLFLFNASGTRISGSVNWTARGY